METQVSRDHARNARLYLVGLGASFIGGSAMTLAAGIWVKSLTGSSGLAALVSVCLYAPSLLAPLAGLLADRVRRKRLLVLTNGVLALAMLSLLAVRSAGELWLIYVVMACYGAALALIDPAENALFVVMLPQDVRERVNGLRMTIQEGGKLVAPLAGAGLFTLLGGGAVAALTAVTFVVATLLIAALRVAEPDPAPRAQHWLTEVAAGARFVLGHADLRAVVITGAFAMFLSGLVVPAQYSLVDGLHRSPGFLGVITGVLGAGSIVAGLASPYLLRKLGDGVLAAVGVANGCVGYALLASTWLPAVLTGSLLRGFALPWTVVAVINLSQRVTPVDLQGRVAAAVGLVLFGLQPVAQLLGAAASAHLDYRLAYAAVAAVSLPLAGWQLARTRDSAAAQAT